MRWCAVGDSWRCAGSRPRCCSWWFFPRTRTASRAQLVVAYLVFLGLAVVHGAVVGLRTRLVWAPRAWLAITLGVVLLAVPTGGVVLYDGARDEATEAMLMDQFDGGQLRPDRRQAAVRDGGGRLPSGTDGLSGPARRPSRLTRGRRVPDRLKTYYATVGAPFDRKNYCDAIAPLKYLRTVPRTMGKRDLGALSTWPDDRLATSLYACASRSLSRGGEASWTTHFSDLLTTFPRSAAAAKVEPAVKTAVDKAAKQVAGGDPCTAVQHLNSLGTQVRALPGEEAGVAADLGKDADRADRTAEGARVRTPAE